MASRIIATRDGGPRSAQRRTTAQASSATHSIPSGCRSTEPEHEAVTRASTVAGTVPSGRLRPHQPRPCVLGHPLRGICRRRPRGPSSWASSSCRATSRRAGSRAAPRKPARLRPGRRPDLAARPGHPPLRSVRGRRPDRHARIGSGHREHASVVRPRGRRCRSGRGTAVGASTGPSSCAQGRTRAGRNHPEEHPLVGRHPPRTVEALSHLDDETGAGRTGALRSWTVSPR